MEFSNITKGQSGYIGPTKWILNSKQNIMLPKVQEGVQDLYTPVTVRQVLAQTAIEEFSVKLKY